MSQTNVLFENNLPNRLTIFRMTLIPVVVGSLFISKQFPNWHASLWGWVAAWTFALASITDYFDGLVARRRNMVTVFGSFLDPIADKFLVVSSLIMLLFLGDLPVFVVLILVLREMYMTSLRLLAINEGVSIPVNKLGKWKTILQMVGIPCVMANQAWQGIPFPLIGKVLVYIATLVSVVSAGHYSIKMVSSLKSERKLKKELKKANS